MYITADKLHDGKKFLPANTAIELSDDGVIKAILQNFSGEATYYEGTICPGLVNAHCHLELSHLKGFIPKHTGLIPFLLQVITGRQNFTDEEKTFARVRAYEELYDNGVVAIGDIANTTDSIDVRSLGKIQVHTFVEVLGFNEHFAGKSFDYALNVYNVFNQQSNPSHFDFAQYATTNLQSIIPHAPYSVSKKLFGLINAFDEKALLSIHNQESMAENNYYINKTGEINDLLEGLKIDAAGFNASGKTSLQTYTEWLDSSHPIIFVHNTFINKEDIQTVQQKFPQSYFCLCPNANLYIENSLPDVKLLMNKGATICIGTDSLASNDKLCIYSELKTLHKHFNIDWEILLHWACYNGAKALQMDSVLGSFEAGKKPGVVQINNDVARRIV